MPESAVNNRRIAKNTIFLYLRMMVVILIGLYTVRAYLDILGETDYGLYNVVGGVVAMFSFVNGTLATSSQRYFSIELAKGDINRLNKWFCLNLTAFSIFILIFIFIAETIGLWFVNTQMTIPLERLFAANVVFQISLMSFCISFISIPYIALIIAHERMSAFAYISIVEAFMKLAIVFILMYITWDKLIVYSVLMFLTSLCITLSYIIYNRRNYVESKFSPYWNTTEIRELLDFSGWHLFGTLSVVVRSQGINILLNMFFNPIVNAARAVAFQFQNAITQLTQSFFKAVTPQMYKSCANEEIKELHGLIMRSTLICFFLTSLLSIPLYFNAEFVLSLWLKETPAYALAFAQLVLINCLIDSVADSTICPALATGKIKKFYLVTGTLYILSLPIAYIFLKFGCEPTSTMLVSIGISIVCLFARAWLLIDLIRFPMKEYLILCGKMVFVTMLIGGFAFFTTKMFTNNWVILVVSTIVSSFLHCLIYLFFVCSQQDRVSIIRIVNNKLHKKRK